jgi:hypothetical protein
LYPEINFLKNDIEILGEDPDNSQNSSTIEKNKLQNKIKNIPQLYTKKFILIQ